MRRLGTGFGGSSNATSGVSEILIWNFDLEFLKGFVNNLTSQAFNLKTFERLPELERKTSGRGYYGIQQFCRGIFQWTFLTFDLRMLKALQGNFTRTS